MRWYAYLKPFAQACDLLWADPAPNSYFQGFAPNRLRGVSCYFGEDVVVQTCDRLGLDIVVRAHQVYLDGYSFFCRRRLITIFSAPMYDKETVWHGRRELVTLVVCLEQHGRDNERQRRPAHWLYAT